MDWHSMAEETAELKGHDMCDDTFITKMRSKLEAARDVRTQSLANAEKFGRALNMFIAASNAHKASQGCTTHH